MNIAILNEILNKLNTLTNKVDKIDGDITVLKTDVAILKTDVAVLKKEVSGLKQHRTEIKSYQIINSKNYEIEITNWLYNYLIIHNFSYFYYIPSNIEFPRELFINNGNIKQKKTLTDLDGIVIGTNNYHIKECYSYIKNEEILTEEKNIECVKKYKNTITNSFIYDIHIIESKHSLDRNKIKKKIRQILILKKIIDNKNSSKNLQKFSNGNIYLYFATPILNEYLYDFINKKEYLLETTWKNDKNKIDINDLNFLEGNIKFITKNEKEYHIV